MYELVWSGRKFPYGKNRDVYKRQGEKIGSMPKETVDKIIDFAKKGEFKEV